MRPLILRIFVTVVIILTGFLLQDQVFTVFNLFNTTPNMLLFITVSFGFLRGKTEGMIVGVICGLLSDVFYGNVLGFYILLYAYVGLFCGAFHQWFYPEQIMVPVFLSAVCDLFVGFCIYIVYYLLQNNLNIGFFMSKIALPETVYTIIITILFYRPLLWINSKIEAVEKRSAKKFV